MVNREPTSTLHRSKLCLFVLAVILAGTAAASTILRASVIIKPICPGVTLTEEIDENPPEIVHILTIDPTTPGIHFEPIPGLDTVTGPAGDIFKGREEVRLLANRHGAVAAVNGDFFPFTGDPLGAAVWNGDFYSEPAEGRCVMGIGADGKTVSFDILGFLGELQSQDGSLCQVTGIDRYVSKTDTNDLVVFTPTYGPRAGIRPGAGCIQLLVNNVNLPMKQSKLELGTITAILTNSTAGADIPSNGVVFSALPGGAAASFITTNCHVGDKVEFVCAIAPGPSLTDAVNLAMAPRDTDDLPSRTGNDVDRDAYIWATMSEVIGGGPHLIINGKVAVDGEAEGFDNSFINDPNPRTGVGVTSSGKILLVTVDGRQNLSRGLSLSDFAGLMLRLGAYNAMNLDGGGSTTMAVKGLIINSIASTGVERKVANVLCVFDGPDGPVTSPILLPSVPTTLPPTAQTPPSTDSATGAELAPAPPVIGTAAPALAPADSLTPVIVGIPSTMTVGQTAQLSIKVSGISVPGSSPDVLWGGSVGLGLGFVDQTGQITALSAGSGSVNAIYKGAALQMPVTITAPASGSPADLISGNLTVKSNKHPRAMNLDIGVFDQNGMPAPNTDVHISVSGGSSSPADVVTDVDGYADATINWNGQGGSVVLTATGLIPKTIQQPQF